jgi:hypothetical protein
MSPSQLLFLAVDAVITAGLVMLVLRRRKSEAGATDKTQAAAATAASDDLRTTTTTVTVRTSAAAGMPVTSAAAGTPRTTAAPRMPGPTAIPGAPETTPETGSLTRLFGRGQLRGLATFAAEQNDRISAYVRDKWSGVPNQLPAVLDALLTDLEHDAEAKGLWLDRETLKSMLVVALRSNRVVDSDVVLEALEKVA